MKRAAVWLAAVWMIAGCGKNGSGPNGGGTPTPPPTNYEADEWDGATASFSGTNNASDNALCVNGGSTDVSSWTGMATVDVTGGGTLTLGDPSDTDNNVAAAECLDANGDCIGSGETPDQCLFLFFSATTANTPEENLQENLLYIIVPDAGNTWTDGNTVTLGTPIEDGSQSYAYGLAAIDNDFNDEIDTDSNGDPVAPDTEIVTGITLDGAGGTVEITEAGVDDGEPVSINGDVSIQLNPEPTALTEIDPVHRASMKRLAERARAVMRQRRAAP